MKRKRFAAVLAAAVFFMLMPMSAHAAGSSTISKEYEFTSKSKDFSYDAPKEITEKGKKYELVRIVEYRLTESRVREEETVKYEELTDKKVPEKYGQLVLDGEPVYGKKEKTVTKVYTGEDIPDRIEVKKSGKVFSAKLKSVSESESNTQTKITQKPFTITGKFYGAPGTVYEWNGYDIDLKDGKTPSWEGSENALIKYFKLPQGADITSAEWSGGAYKVNGETVREATFTGTAPTAEPIIERTATYSYTVHRADATYSNGISSPGAEYDVIAVAEYTPAGLPLWAKVILGTAVGIAVVSLLIAIILYLIRRKRREEETSAPLGEGIPA